MMIVSMIFSICISVQLGMIHGDHKNLSSFFQTQHFSNQRTDALLARLIQAHVRAGTLTIRNFGQSTSDSTQQKIQNPATVVMQSLSLMEQAPAQNGLPIRLKIPSIHVDAAIESLGKTPAGAMAVPDNGDSVAWYNLGPRPGENGSAVLAGHLDSKKGRAVFYELAKVRAGDIISVENENGIIMSFVVRTTRVYDADADATDIFASDSGVHLNLITCGGTWDATKHGYTKRIVVFADASL